MILNRNMFRVLLRRKWPTPAERFQEAFQHFLSYVTEFPTDYIG